MNIGWDSWARFALALALAALAVLVLAIVIKVVARIVARRFPTLLTSYAKPFKPILVLSALILAQVAVAFTWPHEPSRGVLQHVLLIASFGAGAWTASAVVAVLVDRIQANHPIQGDDDQETRRLYTQLSLIRGLSTAAIWLVAAGLAFFTIPGAEAIGTSILASAGVASVIIGIAAQSVLGNVFAGLQLAFNGSIRVDDMVVAQGQAGRVEEMTLTTVVVRTWDLRRIILPSTFFTTTPFENWTRQDAALSGTVHLDVDWRVSPAAMRERLDQVLEGSPLWDHAASGLIIEDATGGMIRVRAVVSAANSSDLFDLRAVVREALVEWVAAQDEGSLPVRRVLNEEASSRTA